MRSKEIKAWRADQRRSQDMKGMLRKVALRPTRQRVALASMLFGKGNRHVTAEILYHEAINANVRLSLATIYNVLHQFTKLGLLRHMARRHISTLMSRTIITCS